MNAIVGGSPMGDVVPALYNHAVVETEDVEEYLSAEGFSFRMREDVGSILEDSNHVQ
jgi:hypothetical protein